MSPDTPWFWIFVGVGTVAVGALLRWVGMAVLARILKLLEEERSKADSRAKVVEETAAVAAERASEAALHAEEMKVAIGVPNGHGDLMTIATEILLQQTTMLASQAKMRGEIDEIKKHLGL